MNKKIFFSFLILVMIGACVKENSPKKISFYHWKSKAIYSKTFENAINASRTNKIYLHYFDVNTVHNPNRNNDEIFPTYVLKNVSKEYQDFKIIPVVYIRNNVFKTKDLDITELSDRIQKLINQITEKHFDIKIKQIQIDCDWTESTRGAYFELLKNLQKYFEVDVTIRLHQVKFKERTGVPPVKNGTLMLYNVGDLNSKQHNSILESSIVDQYINAETNYPLTLNIALPLFSQTIVSNLNNEIKIIKDTERPILENDSHFKKIDEVNFMIVKDTLFKGFFLYKGYNLKLEELKESEIIASYKIIKKSNLKINEIIFYHLDETSLLDINLINLIEKI